MDDKLIRKHLRREFRVIGWLLVAYFGILNIMAMAAAFSEAVNALMKEISGLKKTIQATNILNSNAGKEEPQSVDTILKSFMKGANN